MRAEDFERLYDTHARPLLAFITYRTGDRALAEDVVADTFERVLRARRGFDRRRGSEKTWLYAIALNLVRDRARRGAAHDRALQRIATGEESSAQQLARVELRTSVMEALESLSDEERETVALRFGADLTVPEIAELLGVPLTTAEGRLYRALRRLRDMAAIEG